MVSLKGFIDYKVWFAVAFTGALVIFYFMFFNNNLNKHYSFFGRLKRVNYEIPKDKIKKVVLDNGMTILVFKNKVVPKVLVQIAYDVGSYVERDGERGMAHLIEHMIFKGTEKLSETDILAVSQKYGASFNAFTSKDMTSYYFEVDKNNWEGFVDILADCMQNARFEQQHLNSEFKAVIQELKMNKDNYWRSMFIKASEISYPSNYPYHRSIIGFKEDLVNLKADDLKRFYKKYYKPQRATLFIVGDVDIDHAIEVAKKSFDKVTADKDYKFDKSSYFPELIPGLVTNSTHLYEDIRGEQLGLYWLIPGLREDWDLVISTLRFILGSGQDSRLYKRLVDQEKIAISVSAYASQQMESGMFLVLLEPVKGKIDECRRIVIDEINKIIKDGVSSEELAKIVNNKRKAYFLVMRNLSDFTYEWIESYLAKDNEFDWFEKVNRFYEVDSNQLQKFAGKFLDPFLINQIDVSPLPEDKKELSLSLKNRDDALDKKILDSHVRTSELEPPRFALTLPEPSKLEFDFPKPSLEFSLDNGLDVILHKDSFSPVFSVDLAFKDSDIYSESKDGIALDLMMGMLIEGSKGYSKEENVKFFENRGADLSFNSSGASLSGLSEYFQELSEKFYHVLANPVFDNDALKKLQNITSDYFERSKDSLTGVAMREFKNLIYKNHPFDWSFDDAIKFLQKVTVKDLNKLHKNFLFPENMILSISGDVDLEKTKKMITKIFSSWSGGKYKRLETKRDLLKPNIFVNKLMARDQAVLLMGKQSDIDIYHKDLVPLKLLNSICFNSLGSRLFQLREQTGLFYNAFGGVATAASRDGGFDFAGAILSVDNLDRAEKMIKQMLDDIAEKGITEAELLAARQRYLKILIDLTASNDAIAMMFSRLKSYELGFDYYDKVLKRVQSMTVEELNKVAKKYFGSKDLARVRVGRVNV